MQEPRTQTETTVMNGSELNSTNKVGHLNGRYSNRSIGAVRVRATHADRDDGDEQRCQKLAPLTINTRV
ncbi:MAG: hypothetical protein ACK56F_00170 [bacterium]